MGIEERIEKLEEQTAIQSELIEELMAKQNDKFVTPEKLAEIMQCSKNHIYVEVRKGNIEAIRVGGSIRIPMSQFHKSIEDELKSKVRQRKTEEVKNNMSMKDIVFG